MNTYDEDALVAIAKLIYSKPHTVVELSRRFQKSERTVKRWLEELRKRGYRVVRDGIRTDSPYTIMA